MSCTTSQGGGEARELGIRPKRVVAPTLYRTHIFGFESLWNFEVMIRSLEGSIAKTGGLRVD